MTHSEVDPYTQNARTSGVYVDGQSINIGGDVVGRDKITVGYTVEQVSTLLTEISSTFQPKPFDGSCPYLGLDFFTEDDAGRFFGRERLVSDLLERVQTSRFVIIAGPSGSGKSSLVRAGLLHALKQGALPAAHSDRWLYTTLTPGHDPIEQLALAMSRLAKSPDAAKYMREHSAEVGALHECAESQLSDRKDQRVVIFVDQFEEVFTQISKDSDRVVFLNLLTTAATVENGRVTVLFALRSDFVTNCATYPQLYELVNQQFLLVGAMQPDELVSAIARPALEVGLQIDPDLIAQIVNDMQNEPGALPLMQFALMDLFDAQQAKGGVIALTLDDYLARGGLRKALERHADRAFAKLNPSEQQLAQSIFAGLIEIGSGHEDTRRTASFAELIPASAAAEPVKAVIRKLADARLITTAEQDRKESVTISHERLIDAWPWLRKLIDANREAIALQNEIAGDAQEWDRSQRDASYLYVGARLANAREKLAAKKIVLSGTAQAFVEAGMAAVEEARQREEARRQKELNDTRRRAVVFSAIAIVALVAAGFTLILGNQSNQNADAASRNAATAQAAEADALAQRDEAQHQARITLSRQLAAQSISHIDSQFDLALLLSIESNLATDTIEARTSLLTGLESHPLLTAFLRGHSAEVWSVAFSPNDKTLASGSADNTIMLWDVSNPQSPVQIGAPLKGHSDQVLSVAFSPDGKTLASGSADNTIMLWDVSNSQSPVQIGAPLKGHSAEVLSVTFSPDGKTLASLTSGSVDNTIMLWDVSNSQAPMALGVPLKGHSDQVLSVTFSPDGKTLASLASGSVDNTIMLWDVSNPQSPVAVGAPLKGHSGALSPDLKTLASGSKDNTITLWDVSNPQSPVQIGAPLQGDGKGAGYAVVGVLSAAFSPECASPPVARAEPCRKTLASGSADGTIILWDVSNPQSPVQIGAPLKGHSDGVWSVAFGPTGKTLASGSDDQTIILWDVDLNSWRESACQIVRRNLTQAEWTRYLGDEPYRKTCE